MALPSVRGIGAKANSGNALTVTPYANHVAGDYEVLVVETANQAATLSTAAGFSAITGGVASVGTAAGADGTRMTLFARTWNGTDGDPTIADSGDHQFAYIISFQNVGRVGTPGTNTQAATTAGSITGLSSLSPTCLVVHCSAGSLPDQVSGTEISAGPTNGNLTNLTKQIDETTNSGNGGWIGVITGELAAGGTSGTTTFTKVTSSTMAHVVLPLYGVTTVESSFSANAIIRKPNVSPTGFTADAVIKANSGTKSFSADAVILRNSGTKTFSADAVIHATYGVTYQRSTPDTSGDNWGTSTSAKIAQSFTIINSGRSSARLRVIRFWLKTINAPTDDVILSLSRWSGGPDTPETEIVIPTVATIPASSLNPTTWTEVTATLDYPLDDTHAYYILLGRSVLDDVNYYSLRTSLNDYDSGNLLFKVGGGWIAAPDNDAAFWVEADWASISADASIHKHTTASFSADAFVLGWFTADAWIKAASFPITADAIIHRLQEGSFSADAVLHRNFEYSFTAEAAIHKTHPPFSFAAEAILWREWDKTFASDAVIHKIQTPTGFSADATHRKTQNFAAESLTETPNNVTPATFAWGWSSGPGNTVYIGQAFQPRLNGTISSVDLWLGTNSGSPVDTVTITLETDDGNGKPSGTVLATIASFNGSTIPGAPQQRTYPFSPVAVSKDTTYHFVIKRSNPSDINTYSAVDYGIAGDQYSRGWATYYDTSWKIWTGYDLRFSTTVAYIPVAADAVLKKTTALSFSADAIRKKTQTPIAATETEQSTATGGQIGFGMTAAGGQVKVSQSWSPTINGNVASGSAQLKKTGTPFDNVVIEIQSDDGTGKPSGTVLRTCATIPYTQLTTTLTVYPFSFAPLAVVAGTTYHLVFRRSSALNDDSFFILGDSGAGNYPRGALWKYTTYWVEDGGGTADAVFSLLVEQGPISLDAILKKTVAQSFTADACIKATKLSGSFTTGTAGVQGGFGADDSHRLGQQFYLPVAALLTGITLPLKQYGDPTDDLIAEIQTNTHVTNPLVFDMPSGTVIARSAPFSMLSLTGSYQDITFSLGAGCDANTPYWFILYRTGAYDGNHFPAARLNQQSGWNGWWCETGNTWRTDLAFYLTGNYASAFTTNATFKKTVAGSFTASAFILGWFTADAWIVAAMLGGTFSADAIFLRNSGTKTFTADACIVRTQTGFSFSTDAILHKTMPGSASADAVIHATLEKTFTADAIRLANSGTKTFSADAVIGANSGTKSFAADAVIWASIPGSFSADAILHKEQASSLSADAVLHRTMEGSVSADAVLHRAFEYTFAADATLLASSGTKTFSADAVIARTYEQTLAADAVLLRTEALTFTADAIKHATLEGSFLADAVLWRSLEGSYAADAIFLRLQEGSFTSDASVLRTGTGSLSADAFVLGWFTADAWIAGLSTGFFNADAVIHRNSGTKTFTADAVVEATTEGSFSADATFLATTEGSLSADAVIHATVGGTLTADAVLRATVPGSFSADADIWATVEKTFTADAWFAGTAAGAFSADATFRRTFEETFSADAITLKTFEFSLSADAVLAGTATGSLSGDAVILWTTGATLAADAVLHGSTQGGVDADAIILANSGTKTFTADAWFVGTASGSFSADAVIHATSGTKSFTADAWVAGTGVGAFTGDAIFRRAQAGNFSADAVLHATPSATISADAVLTWTAQHAFSADAVQLKRSQAAFSSDAAVKATRTDGFSASATLFGTVVSSFTADAVFVVHRESTFSVDAILRRTGVGALASDAVIWGTVTGALSASAILTGTRTGFSFTADAVFSLTESHGGSFTADAVISNHATLEIAATAFARTFAATASAVTIDWTAGDMSLTFVQGNTEPPLQSVIHEEDVPANIVDLSTATEVRFQMRKPGDHRYTVNGVGAVLDPLAGLVQYEWAENDLSVPGTYLGQWEIHYPGGGIQTTSPEVEITVRRR